jgi:site-specific recombinase XerD
LQCCLLFARPSFPATVPRKTVAEAAQDYIERSSQKSRKTFIGYRTSVKLFVQNCSKTYFDEIRRDDMLDYLCFLRKCNIVENRWPVRGVHRVQLLSQDIVFLNDRGITKYVAKEDWVHKKDWPINVDKRNKNKKYDAYLEEEIAAILQVANGTEEALIRFLLGTGFRIGETPSGGRRLEG